MPETIQQTLNRADINTLADLFRSLKLGDILRGGNVSIVLSTTAADATGAVAPATGFVVAQQQENARAAFGQATGNMIISAWGRVGAGAPAPLLPAAYPPAAGGIAVAPNGSIATNPGDAWTSMDVSYVVEPGDIIEVTGDVVPATGVMSLPASVTSRGLKVLVSATALTGGVTGNKEVVIAPAAAAGEATVNPAKSAISFAVADAVTTARVRVLVAPSVDVNTALGSTDTVFV